MLLRRIYDDSLAAATYLIGCQRTGEAIVVDPQRDVDRYVSAAKAEGLSIVAVTETHIHADYLSGARELSEETGATVYLSDEGGPDWRYQWLKSNSSGQEYPHVLLRDGSNFSIGNIDFKVIHTPGHTPEHIIFLVTDRGGGATEPMGALTGDFLFVGDLGRPDLLESAAGQAGAATKAAHTLYTSVQKLKHLTEFMQVWPAHGAGSACGKALGAVPMSTIGYELRFNPALQAASSENSFVDFILDGQPEPPLYFARMKSQNKMGPRVLGPLPEPRCLTAQEMKSFDLTSITIIDTRPWDAFRQAHIPGSFFHPLNKSFVTDIGSLVEENVRIHLICHEHEVEDLVRNCIRIGLDHVVTWSTVSMVEEYKMLGGVVVTTTEEPVASVKAKVASGAFNVLDVRRLTEFREGHIRGALNIAHTRLAERLNEVPRDKPLLVHCRSGVRSAYACGLLERSGFSVINMKGGMLAWEASGAPTEK